MVAAAFASLQRIASDVNGLSVAIDDVNRRQSHFESTCGPGTTPDVWTGTCGGVMRTRIWIRPTGSRPDGERESGGPVGRGQGMCYQ